MDAPDTAWVARLDTRALQQGGDLPTKTLVVVNRGMVSFSGVAVFPVRFPVRAEKGPQTVTVRDNAGCVVPSRRTRESFDLDAPGLPPDRALWTFDLEFFAENVPPRGWRAWAAVYTESPESFVPASFWETLPRAETETVFVAETDCHAGELPAHFSLIEGAI